MKLRKSLIIAATVGTVGVASMVGSGLANAATGTAGTSLVDKIASTFNLNKADVQKVFDQNRSDREAQQQAKVEADLSQAVTDGKITADQKAKILAKRSELQAQRDADKASMQTKTDAERKAAMDAKRAEMQKWASDNGISTEYLRYVAGGHGRGGPGGPLPADSTPSSSSN